jgi:glycosyltransferase involved in cell wall biosynthesis
MIRVAALMDTLQVSGPARQLVAIVEPLRAVGVELHVLAFHPATNPSTPFLQFLTAQGVPHTAVPAYGRLRLRTVRALNAAITALSPDLIQTHSYRPNAHVLLLRLFQQRREPWLAFFHGVTAENQLVKLYHRLDRFMLARADAVAVVADSQVAHVGRQHGVTVVPNAVLPADGDVAAATAPHQHSDHPAVLYVGRLSHEKGVDVLLRAWPHVLQELPAARLRIVGDGPDRGVLEGLVASLGVASSVEMLGHQAEPWRFYREASVVVLPSRSEGIPNVLLEAIARDVPVVATRVGGIPHVLGDPPAGLLVAPDDPTALSTALLGGLVGTAEEQMRHRRSLVRDRFSLRGRAIILASFYTRTVAASTWRTL